MRFFPLLLATLAACASARGRYAQVTPPPSSNASALDPAGRARQVANRLTFGLRPGDIAAIERMGVDRWIDLQLNPERIPDADAERVLSLLETQRKKPFELIADHPQPQELQPRLTARVVSDNRRLTPTANDTMKYRQSVQTANTLGAEIYAARMLRAAQSERQLLEVMVDFWENHFSVSINKSPNRFALLEYDRDVIRPHALGKFRDLLGAVARSPEMLYYLDEWQSIVDSLHPTIPEAQIETRRAAMAYPPLGDSTLVQVVNHRRSGRNENYARELMELHTLGVNGGYSQQDVIEVARALTGWTIDRPDLGGSFLFRPDWHDAGEKTVLGVRIPAGRGVEDGEQVLDIVARHPSTARYIARKLVVHFVSDSAPPALVERAAQVFLRTDGDIREVMRTIITSPEFMSAPAYRAKVKTPFELVVSTLRAMNAPPDTTARDAQLVARLGQPIWGHLTPEGWPDQGDAWLNAGSLLNRVNFLTSAAEGRVPGVSIANWGPSKHLVTLEPKDLVQGVIDELLGGSVSAATRSAMVSALDEVVPNPRAPYARLTAVVGVALASPEFQRR